MLIRAATPADQTAVLDLLKGSGLPLEGVPDHLSTFLLADEGGPVGVAGLEVWEPVGLLRSVAVRPEWRGAGTATRLVSRVIAESQGRGLTDLYLLTTTAEPYFSRFGFTPVPRERAPAALSASAEFRGACPQTATLMHLPLKETAMTQTLTPDRTRLFLDALDPHVGKPLHFQLDGSPLVQAGYHVTEVKAVTIEAMDCGGRPAAWKETVIQLWNPEDGQDPTFMPVEKFLSIYRKVAASVPVQGEAELRFEYGDSTHPTIQYRVAGLVARPDRVTVNLGYPAVSCKPRDERLAAETSSCAPGSGCCAPSAAPLVSLEDAPIRGRC